jgi:hypothetical protein
MAEEPNPTMEVHHHPDLHHKKKRWKEYLLEFIMIFLAVTLGFFAESLRETISDKQKEKEYIFSLVQNLKDDTAVFNSVIHENQQKEKRLESLLSLATKNIGDTAVRRSFYLYSLKGVSFYSVFKSNDATMLQLKNSGGFRFIKKDHVADSIAKYDNEVKIIYAAEELYIRVTNDALKATLDVMDYTILHDTTYYQNNEFRNKYLPLLTEDRTKMKLLYNYIEIEIGGTENYLNNLKSRLPFAASLINFLKKEYALD